MINWRERYNRWMNYPDLDERLREELQRAKDNEPLLEDLFYADLEFGTGGMRAEMGPGPNRMNVYTVRKISEGLARFIAESGQQAKAQGVVIAYDSRNKSSDFAIESAKVIGRHGIRVYLFDRLCPTPFCLLRCATCMRSRESLSPRAIIRPSITAIKFTAATVSKSRRRPPNKSWQR